MALTPEQQKNENLAQDIRFGSTVPSDTPVPTTESISSTTLKTQPEVVFPEPKTDIGMTTAESVLKGTGDSMINQLRTQAAESAAKTSTDYASSLDTYLEQLSSQTGFSGFLAKEEKERGTEAIGNEIASLQGQVNTERLARAELKTRLEQKGGGLQSGASAEYQNFARDSLFRETNSIIQLGVRSGQLANAQAAAERVAKAYYEQEQNQLTARKELVDRNESLFDKAELRSFNLEYDQATRELDKQQKELETLQKTKLEALKMAQLNDAPQDILAAISGAETPEQVLELGGQYGSVDMLDRALKTEQLNSLRSKPEALRPTSVIDQGGRKLLIDTQTGDVIQDFGVSNVDVEELQKLSNEQAVKQVYDLRSHKGLNSSVGPIGAARIALIDVFGAKDDFIAGIDNLTKDLTLDNLIKAKNEGATFGALSNAELQLLAESATKINNWREGERGSDGSIISTTGYDASQKDFMKELDRIAYYRVLDSYKKGSVPEDLGLATTPDNKVWFRNSDGSVTEIK